MNTSAVGIDLGENMTEKAPKLFKAFLSVEDSDNIVIVADEEYPHLSLKC